MFGSIALCYGRASENLGDRISELLGIDPEPVDFTEFSNGNLMINFPGNTVREKDVFVLQSGERSILQREERPCNQISNDIMELLQMIYALRDSAGRITAVTPYFPYARSDKKDKPRIAITAKMIFDLIEVAGADRVLTMNLHCPQSQGFSNQPVDQLHAFPVFLKQIMALGSEKLAFIAPDSGSILDNDFLAMHTAREIRRVGGTPSITTGYVKKERVDDSENPRVRTVEGVDDLSGRKVIISDDEILSGRSLILAAETALSRGAEEIYAFVTHGIMSGQAVRAIEDSPISRLYITDTVEYNAEKAEAVAGHPPEKIETLTVAPVFAEAIERIHTGRSLSSLFL
jgi:ribose-phosphate pyrophosphokinase